MLTVMKHAKKTRTLKRKKNNKNVLKQLKKTSLKKNMFYYISTTSTNLDKWTSPDQTRTIPKLNGRNRK